jgi:uncharacterized protein YjbI with pentapeptide repeats
MTRPSAEKPNLLLWRNHWFWAAVALILVVLAVAMIWAGYRQPWTGFGPNANAQSEVARGKTLWDWLELVLLPLAVAGSAACLAAWANRRAGQEAEDREAHRAFLRRQGRLGESVLHAYIDRITALLDRGLDTSDPGDAVRGIARAHTLTVLQQLDGAGKRILVLFLYELGLLGRDPAVDLRGADLSQADLKGANLGGANLSRANLTEANLSEAGLEEANLSEAILRQADLSQARLNGADLSGADLCRAYLSGVALIGANLSWTDLSQADLSGAILADAYLTGATLVRTNLHEANLDQADLSRANLSRAFLSGASLNGADLSGAWLEDAYLSGTTLERANLKDARVSGDQLTAYSLKGATMPDGTVHE